MDKRSYDVMYNMFAEHAHNIKEKTCIDLSHKDVKGEYDDIIKEFGFTIKTTNDAPVGLVIAGKFLEEEPEIMERLSTIKASTKEYMFISTPWCIDIKEKREAYWGILPGGLERLLRISNITYVDGGRTTTEPDNYTAKLIDKYIPDTWAIGKVEL